ncbi:MAG: hypothetical protein R3F38_03560 [Gammaproteobacteria bacterium]
MFNFAQVTDDIKTQLIECLFMIGHSPEFIAEALGEDIRFVAQSLRTVVDDSRPVAQPSCATIRSVSAWSNPDTLTTSNE